MIEVNLKFLLDKLIKIVLSMINVYTSKASNNYINETAFIYWKLSNLVIDVAFNYDYTNHDQLKNDLKKYRLFIYAANQMIVPSIKNLIDKHQE